MKRKSGYIKAEVNNRSESGTRTYLITLTAPVSTVEFTDLLVERKVIGSLDNQLKQAANCYSNQAECEHLHRAFFNPPVPILFSVWNWVFC